MPFCSVARLPSTAVGLSQVTAANSCSRSSASTPAGSECTINFFRLSLGTCITSSKTRLGTDAMDYRTVAGKRNMRAGTTVVALWSTLWGLSGTSQDKCEAGSSLCLASVCRLCLPPRAQLNMHSKAGPTSKVASCSCSCPHQSCSACSTG